MSGRAGRTTPPVEGPNWYDWQTLKRIPKTKPHEIKADAKSGVDWDDVAGEDEAKSELQEVVEFLRLGVTGPKYGRDAGREVENAAGAVDRAVLARCRRGAAACCRCAPRPRGVALLSGQLEHHAAAPSRVARRRRTSLFLVAKGRRAADARGLRTVFRYHGARGGVPAGNPLALRHTFGTALAEAGVDLAVLQALMGHDHIDSAMAYVHLAPAHVRAVLRCRSRSPAVTRAGRWRRALIDAYLVYLARTGRKSDTRYERAAERFFARWPDPMVWAAEPLKVEWATNRRTRTLVMYLMLHRHLRPGNDYLLDITLLASVARASGEPAPRRP